MATCSECTYLNLEKEHDHDGKFWCEAKYEWYYADCAECWRFCRAYSRDSQKADSFRNYSTEKQSSGGCFITTMLCEVLKLSDDNFYLQLLRMFRKNYLQKNPNTICLLEEYDFVGPLIANCIRNDKNNVSVASKYFLSYIVPACDALCLGKYDCAVKQYMNMVYDLMDLYNLGTFKLVVPKANDFDCNKDYSEYGHGVRVKK